MDCSNNKTFNLGNSEREKEMLAINNNRLEENFIGKADLKAKKKAAFY